MTDAQRGQIRTRIAPRHRSRTPCAIAGGRWRAGSCRTAHARRRPAHAPRTQRRGIDVALLPQQVSRRCCDCLRPVRPSDSLAVSTRGPPIRLPVYAHRRVTQLLDAHRHVPVPAARARCAGAAPRAVRDTSANTDAAFRLFERGPFEVAGDEMSPAPAGPESARARDSSWNAAKRANSWRRPRTTAWPARQPKSQKNRNGCRRAPFLTHEQHRDLRQQQVDRSCRAHRRCGRQHADALAECAIADLVVILQKSDEGGRRQLRRSVHRAAEPR